MFPERTENSFKSVYVELHVGPNGEPVYRLVKRYGVINRRLGNKMDLVLMKVQVRNYVDEQLQNLRQHYVVQARLQ